jgi:hypothetical protein
MSEQSNDVDVCKHYFCFYKDKKALTTKIYKNINMLLYTFGYVWQAYI